MSLADFARKEWRIAREQGIIPALSQATGEVTMKAAQPYTDWKATPIWDADFDVCLVLDSCRWDLWQEVTGAGNQTAQLMADYGEMWPLVRNSTSVWSVGSASPEWLSKTFADQYEQHWRRSGYVTANPFSGKQGDELAALDPNVVPLADRGLAYLDEVWRDQWPTSDELPTVGPETLTDRALWAWNRREQYSMERVVVHYMQPHVPFKKRPEWTAGWDVDGFGTGGGRDAKDDWHKVRDGDIPRDEFWNAYAANLEWVLSEVKRWYEQTDARILITSDHGNAMGEWNQWGHPPGSANPAIRKVPWCLIDGVGDGEISVQPRGNPPVVGEQVDVEGRLEALGYV